MKTLYALQNDFQNALLLNQTSIVDAIIETSSISAALRLNIYCDAYITRLKKALASNYPCLKIYVGEEYFHALCVSYIKQQPSTRRSIRWYGDQLYQLISTQLGAGMHYLAELAFFEWNMTLAYDAEDCQTIQMTELSAIPQKSWENMRFTLHPSLRRMDFFWNVISIWESLKNDQPLEEPIKSTQYVSWILWRRDFLNRFYPLEEDEAWAIDMMCKQVPLADICDGLSKWHQDDVIGIRMASLLSKWIQAVGNETTLL